MRRYKVYLSGPLSGHTAQAIGNWRDVLKRRMEDIPIDFFDPMRHKEFLKDGRPMYAGQYGGFKDTPDFILGRDFNDCTTADVVVVNFSGITQYSPGTSMEIAWAYMKHIPTVLIAELGNPNIRHPLISACCNFKVINLGDAEECIRTILFP